MAVSVAVQVPALYVDPRNVSISNFYSNGMYTKQGRCVVDIEGHEAEVGIEDLLKAVLALESVNGIG